MKDFCIVRILGNDLPPRHGKHQTLKNLEFILKYEQSFPECDKYWLINRIIDHSEEKAIQHFLETNNQKYCLLPFDLSDYDLGWTDLKKIQYIIQLNRARNIAIDLMKREYRWIFPFDGSIYFTPDGWRNVSGILRDSQNDLMKINMYRVRFNNQEALTFSVVPALAQEPQVAIRAGSNISFDESLSYGRGNKEELLNRHPDAPCFDYVIRLCDYSAGFITKKRWKDREEALKNLVEFIEIRLND